MADATPTLARSLRTRASSLLLLLRRRSRPRPLVELTTMITFLVPAYILLTLLLPAPTTPTSAKTPLLPLNFPDPCIIHDAASGQWYAFATGWWAPPSSSSSNTTTTTTTTTNNNTTTPEPKPSEPSYKHIQAASAPHPLGPWTYLPLADPLPFPGNWTAGPSSTQTWAPSLIQLNASSFVLYYAAQLADAPASLAGGGGGGGNSTTTTTTAATSTTTASTNGNGNNSSSSSNPAGGSNPLPQPQSQFHCIGAATSRTILGPYTPLPQPVICPADRGGAIDPAGFLDPRTGRRWLAYKVDGNALGEGGECNNGVGAGRDTPIVLVEVDGRDGVTVLEGGGEGEGVEVLDRVGEVDGPLVEAPDLLFVEGGLEGGDENGTGEGSKEEDGGSYVLFYSNHCWDGPGYSVNYAVAENITGPYERRSATGAPLIGTGDGFNVTAPGGAATVPGGGWMVFHGDCPEGRCMFGAEMKVVDGEITVS